MNLANMFMNPVGLLALLSLIPFILLYLIRPKPEIKTIPSLMFLTKSENRSKRTSFLRTFMRNLLFIIQLLVLVMLSVAVAMPYTMRTKTMSSENTAIVIDVSASSQTHINSETRFEKSVELAKKNLADKNTIILAADKPELFVKDKERAETLDELAQLKPKDTTTNLGDAMLFAGEELSGKEGRVIVISDFVNSETDYITAKNILETKNIRVDLVDVSNDADNIGIIDLIVNKENSMLYVKNYYDAAKDVPVKVNDAAYTMHIAPKSVETLSFLTPPGITKIKLDVNDDFAVDNEAYISSPLKTKIDILLITNEENTKDYIYYALAASDKNNIQIAKPPIVPKITHDIIIIDNVQPELLLKETVREIKNRVEDGASAVIFDQDKLFDINFQGIMPVEYVGHGGLTNIAPKSTNKLTKDIDFGVATSYTKVKAKEDVTAIALSDEGNPLITYSTLGKGAIIYYGLDDDKADFKISPTYPIFWNNLIQFLLGIDDINQLNIRTGQTVGAEMQNKAGIFDIGKKKVAVNLLSEKESDVSKPAEDQEALSGIGIQKSQFRRPYEVEQYFIYIALALVFIELLYIKIRGDI